MGLYYIGVTTFWSNVSWVIGSVVNILWIWVANWDADCRDMNNCSSWGNKQLLHLCSKMWIIEFRLASLGISSCIQITMGQQICHLPTFLPCLLNFFLWAIQMLLLSWYQSAKRVRPSCLVLLFRWALLFSSIQFLHFYIKYLCSVHFFPFLYIIFLHLFMLLMHFFTDAWLVTKTCSMRLVCCENIQ